MKLFARQDGRRLRPACQIDKGKESTSCAVTDDEPPISAQHDEASMDVSNIASLASNMAQARTGDAVSIAVQKKAMDMQSSVAAMLIESINQVPSVASNLPAHIGQNINTTA